MSVLFDFMINVITYIIHVDVVSYAIIGACLYCLVLLFGRITGGIKQ